MAFYAYLLRCSNGAYYAGHTDELTARIGAHQTGALGGHTSRYRPVELVWSQEFPDRDCAFAAERQIKGWSRAKKEALIRGDWDGVQYVTKEFHRRLRKSQLRAGDLLFVRVGANRGDCCSVPNDVGEINCANIVFARPTEGNATYLERYCESAHGRAQLLGMTTGSAQGVINTSSVAELVLPIPPLLEQKRIVDSLNKLQDNTQRLESIYQQKLVALDELKKSLLHQAFTGQL